MIDEYFGYRLGALEYRSVRFETETLDCDNYQGNAVVNYTDVPELRSVLELIRDHNAVLGTAHIAPEEIFTVVEAARDMGVKNIVVTHPEWWIVGMSHEDQLRLVKDYDVILERCYAQNMGGGKYKSNLADNLELIKEVGYKNVMVDTDGGQTENPHWELALAEYMQYLVPEGTIGRSILKELQ